MRLARRGSCAATERSPVVVEVRRAAEPEARRRCCKRVSYAVMRRVTSVAYARGEYEAAVNGVVFARV